MPTRLPDATLARPPEVQTSRPARSSPPRAKDCNTKFDRTLREELRGNRSSESPDAPKQQTRTNEQAAPQNADRAPAGGERAGAQPETSSRAQTPEQDAQELPVGEVGAAPEALLSAALVGELSFEVPVVQTDGRGSAPSHQLIPQELARTTSASAVLQPPEQRAEGAVPAQAPRPTTGDDTRPADPRPEERAASAPRSTAPVVSSRADRETTGGFGSQEDSGSRPALGRAMQVQAAVALENATGQPALADHSLAGRTAASDPAPGTTAAQTAVQSGSAAGREVEDSQDAFTARVVRGLGAALNQRGGVMTMRLEPPDLGQLRVHLTIARGVVTAQFQPSTAEAHALLDRSMASLRSALEGHGLTVDRLTVQAPPMTTLPMRDNPADQQAQNQRHDPDAGQGQSRGRGDGRPDSSRHPFSDPRQGLDDDARSSPLDAGADQK